jgi:transposase InsO family protein
MKDSTLLAPLQWLGITPSFSRPRASDDNTFPEALFRNLKYCPSFADKPFSSLEEARSWVSSFVARDNSQYRHSAILFRHS